MNFNKGLFRCALGVALILGLSGCGWFRSSINASPGLRWWLFSSFGAQQICPEMLKRAVALRLTPGGNVVGRFFPARCQHQVNEAAQTVIVDFEGSGFAWTPIAGRVGFAAHAAVEYRMDFFMADEALYLWGQPYRVLLGPEFRIGAVENQIVDWARRSPVGYLGNTFGAQIASSHLASGFTVVRTSEGDEFALGHLNPPARPPKPFDLSGSERVAFVNETTEINSQQVDFLGPFEIADDDQALFFRFVAAGPPVDALLLQKGTSDLWREGLALGAPLGPPPQAPILSWVLNPGPEDRRRVPLPRGQYVLVLDNSAQIGSVAPAWNPLSAMGAGPAVISLTAELGADDADF